MKVMLFIKAFKKIQKVQKCPYKIDYMNLKETG